MRRVRVALTVVGLFAVGIGLAALVRPSLAAALGLGAAFRALGNGYFAVAGVGGLLLAYAFRVAIGGVSVDRTRPFPVVETRTPTPTPGAEVDRAVRALHGDGGLDGPSRPVAHRDNLRERLRADAVATLVVRAGYAPETAEEAVAEGTWTDDRFAADYLGGPAAPAPRLRQRVVARLVGPSPTERRVRRTIDALERLGADP